MRSNLSRTETLLLAACAALLAAAAFGPALHQPALYHAFADRRVLAGVPHAMDVLSNLPFAIAGLAGMATLGLLPPRRITNVQRAVSLLFFAGLLLTSLASSWYHWQPDDAGLAVDRIGMAVAFAGLLGLAAAEKVSERAGAALGLSVLLLAPLAVHVWASSGNVLPWALLQFGGMALVVLLASLRSCQNALGIRWSWVIVAYAAAKLLEMHDHEVFRLTGELVSGHTLKHVVAAMAAWPVASALGRRIESRQNAIGMIARKESV